MSGGDGARFRAVIEERRAALLEREAVSREAAATVELDQTRVGRLSRMDALQQQAMASAAEVRRRAELRRLDAALARIDAGDFGVCEQCDEPIARRRLEVDPGATRCIACAEQAG